LVLFSLCWSSPILFFLICKFSLYLRIRFFFPLVSLNCEYGDFSWRFLHIHKSHRSVKEWIGVNCFIGVAHESSWQWSSVLQYSCFVNPWSGHLYHLPQRLFHSFDYTFCRSAIKDSFFPMQQVDDYSIFNISLVLWYVKAL